MIDFGFSFSLFYATSKGLGLHDEDIDPQSRPSLNRANYAFTVLYNPALMAVKSSILVFYLTLTSGEKGFRWANYVTLFVVNTAGLGLTLVNVFQCRPVGAAFAYPTPPGAHCTDILTIYLSSSPVNIITDLAILFLPNPILTKMRLPRKQKIILVITFSFGFFVAVVDVIRIAYLQNAATSRQIALRGIHLGDKEGDDINCRSSRCPQIEGSQLISRRVRLAVLHVVSRRGQCLGHVRLRTQFETPRGPSHSQDDPRHR